jgi:NAD(P)-dependent dehydrogenase (short-subunit alcohol dehydrogenase family)
MGAEDGPARRDDGAALHEIRVQGHLDDRWAEWAEGLTLTRGSDGTTTLAGPVADQAALHGLLNRVRDLNVPIVSVRRVSPDGKPRAEKVCVVGASGKLGQYLVRHALDRGYEVVGVCRPESVGKLDAFKGRITVVPGATDDREVIRRAVSGCDGVLAVLVPRGVDGYSTGTAQAVLDYAPPGARLVFSSGWHITRDGQDVYSWKLKAIVGIFGPLARLARFADLDDQVQACRRVFASDARWTLVRGSDLEEGEGQGLPVWSRHVGDPILASNLTRRVDFARFMVEALANDALVHEAPAIVGCQTASALAHTAPGRTASAVPTA